MAPDILLIAQGLYYGISGIWPIVHIRSFLAVTGPKTDLWLVKTVGILITVIGGVLMIAGLNSRTTTEILVLALGTLSALTAVDVVYVAEKQIPKIYLLDALVELVFLLGWVFALR